MKIHEFYRIYDTEEKCIEKFRSVREPLLGSCPRCGAHSYRWVAKKNSFECTACRKRISLTSGTVMEKSKIPMRDWFQTMHLMTSIKQVLSAKEIMYQLSYDSYEPVWLMMMKLRDVMGKRDNEYNLDRWVEVDEAFFPTSMEKGSKGKSLSSGLGSEQMTKVLVIVKSMPVTNLVTAMTAGTNIGDLTKAVKIMDKSRKHSVKSVVQYVKMFVLKDLSRESIESLILESVDQDTVIVTDAFSSHMGLKEYFQHFAFVEGEKPEQVVTSNLPWVHIVAGECRDAIAAIHRTVDRKYLQLYLNEYCWKFNRRYFRSSENPEYDLFHRLLRAAATYTSDIKWRDCQGLSDEEIDE